MSLVSEVKKTSAVDEGFATVVEAAAFLRVGRTHVYHLMQRGQLPYAKFGKSRRIPWVELRAFAARSIVGNGQAAEAVAAAAVGQAAE